MKAKNRKRLRVLGKILFVLYIGFLFYFLIFSDWYGREGTGEYHYNLVLFMGLTIAAMITASVVVVVGSISYIGLIVPNIVAMFKGDRIRGTLIDTALFGAIFVLLCDIIARSVIRPYELPIELVVGIIGSIIFIVMLLYRLKNGNKAIEIKKRRSRSE